MDQLTSQIFVDDTDPSITYVGPWTAWNLASANDTYTQFIPAPLYGTLHILNGAPPVDPNASYSIVYEYQGTDVSAQFITKNPSIITTCVLDNSDALTRISSDNSNIETCTTTGVTVGNHVFAIGFMGPRSDPTFFDGMFLASQGAPIGDTAFGAGNDPAIAVTPGAINGFATDRIDLTFTGYSLGLYFQGTSASSDLLLSGSYTFDGSTPLNFTFNDSIGASDIAPSSLLIQTPRSSLGQHQFHVDLFNNVDPFNISVIIQNSMTGMGVNLPVVPPLAVPSSSIIAPPSSTSIGQVPATSSQSDSSGSSSDHLGTIIGCTLSAVIILGLLIRGFYWRRRWMKRLRMAQIHYDGAS